MAEDSKAGYVVGAGGVIAAIWALSQRQKEPTAVVTLDADTLKLLATMASNIGSIDDDTSAILAALGVDPDIPAPGVVPNANGITATRVLIAAPGIAYRFPSIMVPDDMHLVIKAWPTNAGIIYVGGAAHEAINVNQSYPLLPNDLVSYRVDNAERIWVSGDTAGDFVVCTAEQRR